MMDEPALQADIRTNPETVNSKNTAGYEAVGTGAQVSETQFRTSTGCAF
jgi:hypothetical protein